jgi:hypothetical protein
MHRESSLLMGLGRLCCFGAGLEVGAQRRILSTFLDRLYEFEREGDLAPCVLTMDVTNAQRLIDSAAARQVLTEDGSGHALVCNEPSRKPPNWHDWQPRGRRGGRLSM